MQRKNVLVRKQSLLVAKKLKFSVNETLPLLDEIGESKPLEQVASRLLCLHVSAACAFGFDRSRAIDWIEDEALERELISSERQFIETGIGNVSRFQRQIEGMWALAWALSLLPELDFARRCDNKFVDLLPDLTVLQSSDLLRSKAELQPTDVQFAACDLAYCLHWSIRQAELTNTKVPGKVPSYVIIERRRALEWLIGSEQWDQIPLDT